MNLLQVNASPLTPEAALELFVERTRRGEILDPEEFAAQFPEFAPDLASALGALLAIERAVREPPPDAGVTPERIGAFHVVREIGRGGMGVVLEAVEQPLGRRVALKVLPGEFLQSASARGRFRREAELAARLDHSGIATVYGAGVDDGQPWIAMRYVEGETLAHAIARARAEGASCVRLTDSPVSERAAALAVAACLAAVARALHSAHAQGVVHRDVKPSNVIVTPEGQPVLLDFGLAIDEDSEGHSLSRTGETAGTPAYLAPESLDGTLARPDAQSDVYALGVTLYECLSLRKPFEAPTRVALYRAISSADPIQIGVQNRAVPRDLAVVVATAMERDRGRRYRSAAALAEDLQACVEGRPIQALPIPLHGRAWRWVRREPRLALAGATAVTIAIAGLAVVSWVQAAARDAIALKNQDLSRTNGELELAKELAQANERQAAKKTDDVLSLSAIQELKELFDEAEELWPATPELRPKYEDWLDRARTLTAGRAADPARGTPFHPGLDEHRAKLAEIRQRADVRPGEPTPGAADAQPDAQLAATPKYLFADAQDRWWHAQLVQLVADLEAFQDEQAGGLFTSGTSVKHGWGIPRRLAFASTVEERSVSGAEARRLWGEATDAIAKSPKYAGMRLSPQLGLLPIGADRDSGLWEFAHLASGEPAARASDGKLEMREESGLVLVLIPGGTTLIGAQKDDPAAPNYDPDARPGEGPVHEVTLSPYFLSKFEMTQGQWLRFTGKNPSYYLPGRVIRGHRLNLCHPVEAITWFDCLRVLSRLSLSLPSEAQWENGCRAGTITPWWTGPERESLQGKVNIADRAAEEAGAEWGATRDWPEMLDGWVVHAPVGSLPPNPFGLYEVHGNVKEWCLDGYNSDFYSNSSGEDPVAPWEKTARRSRRGGSYVETSSGARSAFRHEDRASSASNILGVRPAMQVQ